MPLPNYVKIEKDGITYESGADRMNYTIRELSRAALRDCGKILRKKAKEKAPVRSGRLRQNIGVWVRKVKDQELPFLQVGYKKAKYTKGKESSARHAHLVERGTKSRTHKTGHGTGTMPAHNIIYNAVTENIDEIRKIQGAYLSAVDDENRALGLIDEEEYISDDDE
jgi:HK97 gp10 family phage protein